MNAKIIIGCLVLIQISMFLGCTPKVQPPSENEKLLLSFKQQKTSQLLKECASLKKDIEKSILQDGSTRLKEQSLAMIKKTEEKAQKVIKGEISYNEVSLQELEQKLKEMTQIKKTFQNAISITLDFGVSFPSGKYTIRDMKAEGKEILKQVCQKIFLNYQKYKKAQFKKYGLIIKLHIAGYADTVGQGRPLRTKIDQIMSSSCTGGVAAQRKCYNRVLSLARAEAVKKYLMEQIYAIEGLHQEITNKLLVIQAESVGRGEELPDQTQQYTLEGTPDKQRRLCKLNGNIFTDEIAKFLNMSNP